MWQIYRFFMPARVQAPQSRSRQAGVTFSLNFLFFLFFLSKSPQNC